MLVDTHTSRAHVFTQARQRPCEVTSAPCSSVRQCLRRKSGACVRACVCMVGCVRACVMRFASCGLRTLPNSCKHDAGPGWIYIGSILASPTAWPLRGYGCAGTQNDRASEAVILSTGTPIPAQLKCRRRCRDRALSRFASCGLRTLPNSCRHAKRARTRPSSCSHTHAQLASTCKHTHTAPAPRAVLEAQERCVRACVRAYKRGRLRACSCACSTPA